MNNMTNIPSNESDSIVMQQLKAKMQKDLDTYSNYWLKEKKDHWVWVFITVFNKLEEWEKIDIPMYRKNEPDIDLFLNDAIDNICWYAWQDRETILSECFILDEQAKKYIRTDQIEWVIFTSEDLSEKIWDLFYDWLASFLLSLSNKILENANIDNRLWNTDNLKERKQLSEYLKIASNHIMNAWHICLPYVWQWFPNLKHSTEIKWLGTSKEELAIKIWNLNNVSLKEFLLNLSKKIHKDWISDEWRWRKKLSNELFETAKNLEIAWNLL